ncbi:hypothetical protein GOZ81_14585 [Agrobacterium vitis]|uniref:di-heme-cytochrome C peroxidase n=1 Tax=Agrobacterium vitis TaxID=373 RepID=UPI0012E84D91|nr:di-heme-cytochrome C peroxidase [Agrobacterium vitis]MVA72296.1 hypothetical protein [Agrobacterium vitis]
MIEGGFVKNIKVAASFVAALCLVAGSASAQNLVYTDQGSNWSAMDRAIYYTQDQGSRLMPLSWMQALTLPDGTPFLADNLTRYGYLTMDGPNNGLPVGFTVTGPDSRKEVGMTCAACHTREISVSNIRYRIDGGPALSDFHSFLLDLDASTQKLAIDPAAFDRFAKTVLGTDYQDPSSRAQLQVDFTLWTQRYHAIVSKGVPHDSWGVGRLDAVGMIFNRLTGLDLGPPPSRLIVANIQPADAPVRYPFLWNAAIQDRTQWPGFAANGSDILGLARNVGEVYGVFGVFEPTKEKWSLLGYDYLKGNSLNFEGLSTLEDLIKQMGPPKYPFAVDATLASKGETLFNTWRGTNGSGSSCFDCHGQKPGTPSLGNTTWATPLVDVGTDSREYNVMNWTASPGVMTGARIPFANDKLAATSPSIDILTVAVEGSILQHYAESIFDLRDLKFPLLQSAIDDAFESKLPELNLSSDLRELQNAFPRSQGKTLAGLQAKISTARKNAAVKATGSTAGQAPDSSNSPTTEFKYESRVLYGIWATAPYLHNGSVPTLADLLKSTDQRPQKFAVGADYDPKLVGIATTQTGLNTVTQTTDCSQRNSGNSRCGHEFGTDLSDNDKAALLEYLKTL